MDPPSDCDRDSNDHERDDFSYNDLMNDFAESENFQSPKSELFIETLNRQDDELFPPRPQRQRKRPSRLIEEF